jgi:hypothetical protein
MKPHIANSYIKGGFIIRVNRPVPVGVQDAVDGSFGDCHPTAIRGVLESGVSSGIRVKRAGTVRVAVPGSAAFPHIAIGT